MHQNNELPHDVDMEKELLSALFFRKGESVPKVAAIVSPDDFYRPEHQIIFRVILKLFSQGIPPNILSIYEELRKMGMLEKVERKYLFSIAAMTATDAYALWHARVIKEKSDLRQLLQSAEVLAEEARQGVRSPDEIIVRAQKAFDEITSGAAEAKISTLSKFFAEDFDADIAALRSYTGRKTGFANLDEHQLFSPGLYVIGATPAAGKTTFCWQLLEQLSRKGETCIYCSYEMSRLELFSKTLARELFRRDDRTNLTAAQIRRGGKSRDLSEVLVDLIEQAWDLSVVELQNETIDDLLRLLRPLCTNKAKAPVVCLDYLQIVPTNRESTKQGIDEAVRKLKKFQRETNTTFIVISSFNRTNYSQTVSFESFKESGNIEYTADVVWALQLDVLNRIKSGCGVIETRRRIDAAKKRQPRQIQLKCLKNRQGTNYDCYFEYYSAHDHFEPCESFDEPNFSSPYKECR